MRKDGFELITKEEVVQLSAQIAFDILNIWNDLTQCSSDRSERWGMRAVKGEGGDKLWLSALCRTN